MNDLAHITHLLRYVEALKAGDAVRLLSKEEAEAVIAAYASATGDHAMITASGGKWTIFQIPKN